MIRFLGIDDDETFCCITFWS